jgi:hypothetical protein
MGPVEAAAAAPTANTVPNRSASRPRAPCPPLSMGAKLAGPVATVKKSLTKRPSLGSLTFAPTW